MSNSALTKKALSASLKELMKHKELNKITVSDISEHCGVNRQTFYYHFKDVIDLVDWIYMTEAVSKIENYRSYDTWLMGLRMIFRYAEENKNFCLKTYHSFARNHLEKFVIDNTNDMILGVFREIVGISSISDDDIRFITNFYTYSFTGLVMNWMKDGMKEDPDILVDKLNTLIEGDFNKAVSRFEIKNSIN